MKTKIGIVLCLLMAGALIFSGCSKSSNMGKANIIGISKIVKHPALDATEKGIMDEVKAQGINIEFDLQNANGNVNSASTIAAKFKSDNVKIAIGIATPTAQALVKKMGDTPVIFAAVTDPVSAGLVKSLTDGGKDVTGTSDMTPVRDQIILLNKCKPIKRLGHIYSSSESNAVVLAKKAKAVCKELNIEFVESTVTNSSEVKHAALALVDRVDAFYVSNDNTVVSAIRALSDVAIKNKKPIVSADPSSAEKTKVLIAWGFDYYKMGRATGKIVVDVLNGESAKDIPTRFMTDPADVDLLINLDVAKELGITIPDDVVKVAKTIIKNKRVIKK
jgi:putative ABC transport system substrate-binding protein